MPARVEVEQPDAQQVTGSVGYATLVTPCLKMYLAEHFQIWHWSFELDFRYYTVGFAGLSQSRGLILVNGDLKRQ